MENVKRTERGWAGHFICASSCNFRRNTLLEHGDQRVVVSTVGAMVAPMRESTGTGFHKIGLNRFYETMAFVAKLDGIYWDADVTKGVGFESKWAVRDISPTSDQEANDMHESVVEEISQKLIAGSLQLRDG